MYGFYVGGGEMSKMHKVLHRNIEKCVAIKPYFFSPPPNYKANIYQTLLNKNTRFSVCSLIANRIYM